MWYDRGTFLKEKMGPRKEQICWVEKNWSFGFGRVRNPFSS